MHTREGFSHIPDKHVIVVGPEEANPCLHRNVTTVPTGYVFALSSSLLILTRSPPGGVSGTLLGQSKKISLRPINAQIRIRD